MTRKIAIPKIPSKTLKDKLKAMQLSEITEADFAFHIHDETYDAENLKALCLELIMGLTIMGQVNYDLREEISKLKGHLH